MDIKWERQFHTDEPRDQYADIGTLGRFWAECGPGRVQGWWFTVYDRTQQNTVVAQGHSPDEQAAKQAVKAWAEEKVGRVRDGRYRCGGAVMTWTLNVKYSLVNEDGEQAFHQESTPLSEPCDCEAEAREVDFHVPADMAVAECPRCGAVWACDPDHPSRPGMMTVWQSPSGRLHRTPGCTGAGPRSRMSRAKVTRTQYQDRLTVNKVCRCLSMGGWKRDEERRRIPR